MLTQLGRTLRMAGYDTEIAAGTESDHELVLICIEESRFLLSGDRQMQERKAAREFLVYLPGNDEDAWAALLKKKCGVDWLHAPFTRCLECNRVLEALPEKMAGLAPERITRLKEPVSYCPSCQKAYWAGSHVKKMRDRLESLARMQIQ